MIGQKQLANVKYFNYLGNMITNDVGYTQEMKSRTAMAKTSFNNKETLHQQTVLKFKEETSATCYIWRTAFYGAEPWTLGKADKQYLGRIEM
jgi:hypothetical protein